MAAVATLASPHLRCGVVGLLLGAVAAILYLTPRFSNIDFASCDRPCHELEWPMICRVKLVVEVNRPLSAACGDCPWNQSDCFQPHCITADGFQQNLITVNRQLPGPSIHVCENDILLVDVVNRVPGVSLSVHWRGQPQRETPSMDGVPGVTQCAIPSDTTFQYKFRASRAGTHLWHAFTGLAAVDTVHGALVVRKSEATEKLRTFYDEDRKDHMLVLSELPLGQPEGGALLLNGRAKGREQSLPLHTFTVSGGGVRYRFRVANAGGGTHCPINVTLEGHVLQVVALDGAAIAPVVASSLVLASGERADVVLTTDQAPGSYHILASTVASCGKDQLHGAAILQYVDKGPPPTLEPRPPPIKNKPSSSVTVWSAFSSLCDGQRHVCLKDLKAMEPLPAELSKKKVDVAMSLPFGSLPYKHASYRSSHHIANMTFVLPPSPILTQEEDISYEIKCGGDSLPPKCRPDVPCQCLHIINVALSSTMELTLINQDNSDTVLHIHGNAANVVAVEKISSPVKEFVPPVKRQLNHPPLKDTITVPGNGLVILRIQGDNPGYWLVHGQQPSQWAGGMALLLQVGTVSDLPNVPKDFPRCGSWVGPEFLLI